MVFVFMVIYIKYYGSDRIIILTPWIAGEVFFLYNSTLCLVFLFKKYEHLIKVITHVCYVVYTDVFEPCSCRFHDQKMKMMLF